jgi:hypothetical protein
LGFSRDLMTGHDASPFWFKSTLEPGRRFCPQSPLAEINQAWRGFRATKAGSTAEVDDVHRCSPPYRVVV